MPVPPSQATRSQRLAHRRKSIGRILIAWLYVLVGLCLLPALAVAVVYLLLGLVPQSQEVLFAFSEGGGGSVGSGDEAPVNRLGPMLSYAAAQLVAALSVWYAARLLCTIDAHHAVPPFLQTAQAAPAREVAVTWVPRVLGFAAAAALSVVMIHAAALPAWQQGVLFATALLLGPLLLRLHRRWASAKLLTLCVVVLLLLLTGVILVEPARVGLYMVFQALLPPVLLLALDTRREWIQVLLKHIPAQPTSPKEMAGQEKWLWLLLGSAVTGAIALTMVPASMAAIMGPAAVLLFAISGLLLILTPLALRLRRLFRFTPGWPALVGLLALLLLVLLGKAQLGEEKLEPDVAVVPPSTTPARTPLAAAPGDATTGPDALVKAAAVPVRPIAVNVHGGALRAGLFPGLILARLDDLTCGQFGESLVAGSSVSGGSLGLAMYLSLRQDFVARGGWQCSAPGGSAQYQLMPAVKAALSADHLSVVVAKFAFRDIFVPLSTAQRGQALLNSWQTSATAAWPGEPARATPISAGFARPLSALTGGIAKPPRILFNTVEGLRGRRAYFAAVDGVAQLRFIPSMVPASSDTGSTAVEAVKPADDELPPSVAVSETSVGQAVLHSARFPLVSPPGKFELAEASKAVPGKKATQVKLLVFLDGGYVDNSGALTLREELDTLPQSTRNAVRILNISGNPTFGASACGTGPKTTPRDLGIEINALLKVRTENGEAAVRAMQRAYPQVSNVVFDLDPKQSNEERCRQEQTMRVAPLGWFISAAARKPLEEAALRHADHLCEKLEITCTPPKEREVPTKPALGTGAARQ